jgi:hypothetical protein
LKKITITVTFEEEVAEQLAQFCKRSCFEQFFDLTEAHASNEERTRHAYQMIRGVEKVQRALNDAGYYPR